MLLRLNAVHAADCSGTWTNTRSSVVAHSGCDSGHSIFHDARWARIVHKITKQALGENAEGVQSFFIHAYFIRICATRYSLLPIPYFPVQLPCATPFLAPNALFIPVPTLRFSHMQRSVDPERPVGTLALLRVRIEGLVTCASSFRPGPSGLFRLC